MKTSKSSAGANVWHTVVRCNTLQHCDTLQHTATHYNNVWHTVTRCNTLQHCDTLEHTATHCNTLQHTATHCNTHKAEAKERCEWNCSCSNTQMSNVKRQSWCPHLPHCITYDHSYVTCYTLLHTAIQLHTAPHCNTKHTTTHCNTLQHAAEQNNEISTGKISESRNSCSVKVGGVGVEGMISLREIGTLV